MRRLRKASLVLAVVAACAAACSSDSPSAPTVKLDGSPRIPNVEGVATKVTLKGLTIDGHRYRVSPRLQSFSTYDGSAAALLSREGTYVQAGVADGVVGWLAGIGSVVQPEGVVYYIGDLVGFGDGRAIFRDGTTLRAGPGLDTSVKGRVQVELNAARHVVTSITPL